MKLLLSSVFGLFFYAVQDAQAFVPTSTSSTTTRPWSKPSPQVAAPTSSSNVILQESAAAAAEPEETPASGGTATISEYVKYIWTTTNIIINQSYSINTHCSCRFSFFIHNHQSNQSTKQSSFLVFIHQSTLIHSNNTLQSTLYTLYYYSEIFNLIKGIVGAGVLTLPSGIAAFGNAPSAAIPSVALIATIGALSSYGFGLIGRACALTKTTSYRSAWTASVGQTSDWIPAWSVTLKTVFATLAYSMILKDTFHSLILAAGYSFSKSTVLVGITSLVLLPLCLMKNLSSLAPFSLLGSLGMLYTAVAMGIRFVDQSYKVGGKFYADMTPALRPSFGSVGAAGVVSPATSILVGMLSTAYMAHFNAPKVCNRL